MKRLGPFVAVAVLSVLATLGIVAVIHGRGGRGVRATTSVTPGQEPATQQLTRNAVPAEPSVSESGYAELYAAVRSSIVEIDTQGPTGRRRSQQFQGQGSGVVLDLAGHILTNEHVITDAQAITVTFADGSTAQATVLRDDATDDLAVLTTNATRSQLHPAMLGDSGALKVGDLVAAVGNPFGLEGSLSTGVVSGLDRALVGDSVLPEQGGLLQIDAAVNEGSSGGGLFNMRGELVGVTSALENPEASTFAGVGYAVPVNTAKQLLERSLPNSTGTP